MAWNIAGVGRRTRDAAEEAARRAGMRLDDWLDAAIAEQVAEQGAPREKSKRRMICWMRSLGGSNASRGKIRALRSRSGQAFRALSTRPSSDSNKGSHGPKRRRRAPSNRSPKFWSARMPRGTATGRRCFRRCADWRRSRETGAPPLKPERRRKMASPLGATPIALPRSAWTRSHEARASPIARLASSRLRRMRFRRRRESISRSRSRRSPCAARNSTRAPAVARPNLCGRTRELLPSRQ